MSDVLQILQAMYGRLLTIEGPTRFRDMTPGERDALLEQHKVELERDVEALELAVNQGRREGIVAVISAFRTAEGMDPEVVDQLMEAFTDP